MTIPHRIRALLALRGWTVAQLASAAGMPPATVKTHLRGKTDLTGRASGRALSTRPPVEVYAHALRVTVEVLTEAWSVEGGAVAVLAEEAGAEHRRMGLRQVKALVLIALNQFPADPLAVDMRLALQAHPLDDVPHVVATYITKMMERAAAPGGE